MKTEWSERMIKTLQLNGKGERTQESYVRTVRMLTEFYYKTPDAVTEDELREYFLRSAKNPITRQYHPLPRLPDHRLFLRAPSP